MHGIHAMDIRWLSGWCRALQLTKHESWNETDRHTQLVWMLGCKRTQVCLHLSQAGVFPMAVWFATFYTHRCDIGDYIVITNGRHQRGEGFAGIHVMSIWSRKILMLISFVYVWEKRIQFEQQTNQKIKLSVGISFIFVDWQSEGRLPKSLSVSLCLSSCHCHYNGLISFVSEKTHSLR